MTELTVSVLVVLLEKELRLESCLKRLAWADEIVVVSNYITDQSSAIVEKYDGRLIKFSGDSEGLIRKLGIEACAGNWILEIDADGWVTKELAKEIIEIIINSRYNIYTLNVNNYICDKFIKRGWTGSPIGKQRYIGLYRKGAKIWGTQRTNPDEIVKISNISRDLENSLINKRFMKISNLLGRLDYCTTLRARDLAEIYGTTSLIRAFLNFLYTFMLAYLRQGSYKEGAYGFMLALCNGLYPLISNIKAIYEEGNIKEKTRK